MTVTFRRCVKELIGYYELANGTPSELAVVAGAIISSSEARRVTKASCYSHSTLIGYNASLNRWSFHIVSRTGGE